MSQLFVDNIKNRTGGAVGFPTGVVVTGVATFNNQVSIAGTLTYEDVTNIDSTGIVTAKSGLQLGSAGAGGTFTSAGYGQLEGGLVVSGVTTSTSAIVGSAVTINSTGIDVSGIITATSFSGPFSASTGSFTSDVDIADKIVHTGDTNTAIRFPAADTFSVETAGSERLRVDSSGKLLQGKTATKGSTGENVPTYCTEIADTNNPNVLEIANNGTASGSYSALALVRSDGTSVNSHTAVDNGDKIGEVCFIGADGADRFNTAASVFVEAEADFTANDCPARLILATNAGGASVTERLRIDSVGTFNFNNGVMIESVNINTTARNGTQNVDLADGMVHYFSTNSSGTWKPNFRVSSSKNVNGLMSTGDVISPTMIVAKGATSHYATAIQVDGSDVTPEFSGGAPTDGGGSGTFDVYSYTIIKTGDGAFKVFAAISNYE